VSFFANSAESINYELLYRNTRGWGVCHHRADTQRQRDFLSQAPVTAARATSQALSHQIDIRPGRPTYTPYMDDAAKLAPLPLMGDADPVPASLFVSYPEQANTLSLLYEVSREITSILDREELLRRVAQRVKKLVNYHVFTVMLYNERTKEL